MALVLTNVSAFRCSVLGYPRLELIGADGEVIPAATVRSAAGSANRLTVASGRRVSSALHWIGIPLSDEQQTGHCEPAPSRIDVSPLGDPQTLVLDWSFGPVCGHGRIDAGPLQPGVPPN